MSIEIIRQSALAISDAYAAYKNLLDELAKNPTPDKEQKALQLKDYIFKITENIMRYVNEERENVS